MTDPQNKPAPDRSAGVFRRFLGDSGKMIVGWLKAQLILCAVNLVLMIIFFSIFHVKGAIPIAFGVALLDLLPIVGSGCAFIPWIIVCVIIGKTTLALELGLLYIGLIVVRQILDPLITGKNVGIRPIVALGAAVLGLLVLGPLGLILGPLAAGLINVILNLRRRSETAAAADTPGRYQYRK